MNTENEKNLTPAAPATKERQAAPVAPAKSFDQNIAELTKLKLGGFKLIETTIDGADNLNPERRARRNIFLKEADRQRDRDELKARLELWKSLLSRDGAAITDMAEEIEEKFQTTDALLKQNLGAAVESSRDLESAYRGIALFFANAEVPGMKTRNIVFLNAGLEQLNPADVYNNDTIEYVKNELNQAYNKFDMRESYSLMVAPGYLGSKMTVDSWAKIANDHKLMLVTDYKVLDTLKDTLAEFQREKIGSDEARYANVLMACNPIVGRGKYDEIQEEEDLYVCPSTALAGKIHMNIISQVSAGLKFGALEQAEGVKFNLLKTEVGELEGQGLIPLTKEFGKVIPFSGKTLYNGSNIGLKTYSVVRVFDWIMKIMMHFLNKRSMENWSSAVERNITEEIVQFLDKIRGPGKIIDKFDTPKFRQDPTQPDRIFVDINITPFFPAKTFVIGLHGEKGRNENTGRRGEFQGGVK